MITSILVILFFASILYWVYVEIRNSIKEHKQFKKGHNPYSRICKDCGSHQNVFEDIRGCYWGEVYPIGNDESCKCHQYAEYRS